MCKKDAKALHVRALEDAEVARIEARMADTRPRGTLPWRLPEKGRNGTPGQGLRSGARALHKTMQADARAQCLTDARRVYGPGRGEQAISRASTLRSRPRAPARRA